MTTAPYSTNEPETEIDFQNVLGVLRRRRWVALGVVLGCVILGIFVTMRAPRIYRSTALVLIDIASPDVLSDVRQVYDPASGGYWASREYYETQYSIITSRRVLSRAATHLGITPEQLDLDASVQDAPADASFLSLPLRKQLLGLEEELSAAETKEAAARIDVASRLQFLIKVKPIEDSRLVQIIAENRSPEAAAAVANAVADAYVASNLEQKVETTRSAVDWLRHQVRDLKTKLEESERQLHQFKKDNNVISVSMETRQTMISETLSQLNKRLSEVRANRLALKAQGKQHQAALGEGKNGAVLEVIEHQLVQNLKEELSELTREEAQLSSRYTDEHPELLALQERKKNLQADLDREVKNVLQAHKARLRSESDTEANLRQEIEFLKSDALELNRKEIEYKRLKREADNNLELYQMVLKRQKEAELSQMLKVNNVQVHERGLAPTIPSRPDVKINLAISLLIGLAAGIFAAFAVDYLDSSIKSHTQIEQLGLPFLGLMPAIKSEKGDNPADPSLRDRHIITNPRSSIAECSRTIRTNLLFMSPDAPVHSLLITSSEPREGKSTTAVNLAVAMAQSGAKTIVIDTDMRRPRLHKSFKLPNDVGISSVILGEVELQDAVHASEVENLSIITCGPIPPNPAELLHTDSFRQTLERLNREYDRVIFDSPPVGAVTDPAVLASMVDGVVLVVQAGKTSLPAAQRSKRQLQDVRGRIFGVVLNNVDVEANAYRHYHNYYYYSGTYGDDAPAEA